MIKIKPIDRLPISQVSYSEIRINVKGPIYASMSYSTHTEDNNIVESGLIIFSKQELDVWGDDDTVLDRLVLEKLGYEIEE
jgi:hypothetical protein